MSSILKALKKLEAEDPSTGSRASWIGRKQPEASRYDRVLQSWIAHPKLYIGCALAVAALTASLVVVYRGAGLKDYVSGGVSMESATPKARPATLHRESPAEKKLGTAPKARKGRALVGDEPGSGSERAGLPVSGPQRHRKVKKIKFAGVRHSNEPAGSKPEPAADSLKAEPFAEKTSVLQEESRIGRKSPAREKVPPAVETGALSESGGEVRAKILDDARLKLQAISWSEKPEERISVINSSVVHQGDRVDGYVVVQINPNDVVLRDRNEMWKIVFKPR